MSLLLAFFIMLFVFSTVDIVRFREAVISLQAALGILTGGPRFLDPGELPNSVESPSQLDTDTSQVDELMELKTRLQSYLHQEGLDSRVHIELNRRGLLLRFTDTVLFDLGKAVLRPDSRKLLAGLVKFIAPIPNQIIVEGSTDDIPLRENAEYPTNWELSTARATTVVRYLVEEMGLEPQRLSAAGYGEYRPVLPNTSDSNRAQNRRVDIVIVARDENDVPGR
jgi:chemotaxis protein MotB